MFIIIAKVNMNPTTQVTLSGDTSQNAYWQCLKPLVSVYSIQGHRLHMEDRYDLIDPGAVGVQLYSVYDGHGGGVGITFSDICITTK